MAIGLFGKFFEQRWGRLAGVFLQVGFEQSQLLQLPFFELCLSVENVSAGFFSLAGFEVLAFGEV